MSYTDEDHAAWVTERKSLLAKIELMGKYQANNVDILRGRGRDKLALEIALSLKASLPFSLEDIEISELVTIIEEHF